MAKVFSEGSGKGADSAHAQQTILTVSGSEMVRLPDGIDPGTLEMHRDGQNLVLNAPNGETIIVENYFSGLEAPALISSTGALLSPALVQSFLKLEGDIKVAAVEVASDGSPVGEVSEVTGNATVTRADGSEETITNGTKIYEHDIVETDAKGAVNIKFADESTFAVSQNARMAIDDFSFNAADQSGSTGISILRGVFMFTSGLIGRENPDAVHLETPVGSIGIRGTIIGGEISDGGKSQISVLEGAIVVRNGAGEQILSNQFETVQLTSFNAPISNIGQLDARGMTSSYGAVSGVSQQLFTSIQDTAREAPAQQQQQQQPTQDTQPDSQKAAPVDGPQSSNTTESAPAQQAVAQTPAAEAPAQTAPAQAPAPAADVPVFQTLSTGSGLATTTSATGNAPSAPAPAPAPVAPVIVAQPAPAPAPVQTQTVTVAELPPAPQPVPSTVFTFGGSVAENATNVVVGKLGLASSYGANVDYSLINNPGGLFSVSAAGVVTLVGTAGDYDAGLRGYDVVVRATRTDTGIFTDTKLSIGVTNIDEAPRFNSVADLTVAEGGIVTLTPAMIGATDPEGTAITYDSVNSHVGIIVNGQAHSTFTHADLIQGRVQLVHDGSEDASAIIRIMAVDATGNSTMRLFTVNLTPVNDLPVDQHNTTPVTTVGGITVLTSAHLSFSDAETPSAQIAYRVGNGIAGTLQIKDSNGGWNNLTANSTFTQADVNAGKIRFVESGNVSTAGINLTVLDGQDGEVAHTLNLNVNQPAQITTITAGSTFLETPGATTLTTDKTVAALSIADTGVGGIPYDFKVLSNQGGTYVIDNRFRVGIVDGAFQIVAKAGSTFNYETASNLQLKVRLQDGANDPVTSGVFNFNITDVNEAATSITLKGGNLILGSSEYDGEMTGKTTSPIIGVLVSNDPDTGASYRPTASKYQVVSVTGGSVALSVSDLEIVNRTLDDGRVEQLLRLKTSKTFSAAGDTYTVTIALETAGGTITESFTVLGRNDVLVLDNLNGQNGFRIVNHTNEGALFGASLALADMNGDGQNDLVVGVPLSYDGTSQIGGVYGVSASLSSLAAQQKALNQVSQGIIELQTTQAGYYAGTAWGHGQQVVGLNRFDNNANTAIATSSWDRNSVEITYNNGGTLVKTTVSNIDNDEDHVSLAAGDFNGDGYSDLLIGAGSAGDGNGAVGILYGSATHNASYTWSSLTKISGPAGGTGFGTTVASVGDLNGDGYTDFAVNAPYQGDNQGKVSIFFGTSNGTALTTADMTISTIMENNMLGSRMSGAGDFNGDGYDDMMFSRSASENGRGSITLMFGSGSLANTVDALDYLNYQIGFNGIDIRNATGHQDSQIANFANLGDFNGDGYDDIGIDVSLARSDGTYDHTVYLVYGNNSASRQYDLGEMMNNSNTAFKFTKNGSWAGSLSFLALGDIGNDGFDDIAIGDPGANDVDGDVSVIYGAAYAGVTSFSGSVDGATNTSYTGKSTNDTVDSGNATSLSFHGGFGDDTFIMHGNTAALREFDGNAGSGDKLRLFFSDGETGAGNTDTIDLRGISQKISGVERIEFDASSKQDTLILNIKDIISLAQSSDDVVGGFHRLTIAGLNVGNDLNHLAIKGPDGSLVTDLSSLGDALHFTRNAVNTIVNDHEYAVYTNTSAGVQLLVDTTVASATSLATAITV